MDPDPSLFAGVILCLFLLALASAVDAAFTSVSWRRLQTILADRAVRSRILARFIAEPYPFKATIIIFYTGATIAAAALTLHLSSYLPIWAQVSSMAGLALAILVVSAALPKMLALRDPQAVVLWLAGPVSRVAWLCSPIIELVKLLTFPFARLTGTPPRTPLVIAEELRSLVHAGAEEGLIKDDERDMIEGVFSFNDTIVRELMVPRVYVVALDINTPLEKALDTVMQVGHSRIPVYRETIDNIVGVLYAKDLLPILRDGQHNFILANLLRPVHYVPETMKVDALLKDLQQSRVHIAMVIDEYGGTAGLVTIEDLIEEIVGDIRDEYDDEEPFIQMASDVEVLVDARTSIDEINDLLHMQLETTEADRIGGLVYEYLGRVPRVSDEVVLDEVIITVVSMKGVRPQKLSIAYRQCPLELPLPTPMEPMVDPLADPFDPVALDSSALQPEPQALYEMMPPATAADDSPLAGSTRGSYYATNRLHRAYYRGSGRL